MENEHKKHCPLNPSTDEILYCDKEKCAWWAEHAQATALLVIAKALKTSK